MSLLKLLFRLKIISILDYLKFMLAVIVHCFINTGSIHAGKFSLRGFGKVIYIRNSVCTKYFFEDIFVCVFTKYYNSETIVIKLNMLVCEKPIKLLEKRNIRRFVRFCTIYAIELKPAT